MRVVDCVIVRSLNTPSLLSIRECSSLGSATMLKSKLADKFKEGDEVVIISKDDYDYLFFNQRVTNAVGHESS